MHGSAESDGVFNVSGASPTRRRWMRGGLAFVFLMVSALFGATGDGAAGLSE